MMNSSPKSTKHTSIDKHLKQSHREVSTQTALNLEDLNTLLLAFLSPKQEACTQTDFVCDASAMDDSCGRCEGNEENLDSSFSFSEDTGQHQLGIVKQEVTSQDNAEDTTCDLFESSVEEIEPSVTPKSHMNVKAERLTPTSQFSVPPSDRVTRSASRKKSVESNAKKPAKGSVKKLVDGAEKRGGKKQVESIGKKSVEPVKDNINETSPRRRSSARIVKRKLNQSGSDIQNGKVTAVLKLEHTSDDLEIFVCPECGKSFSQASQLKRHAIEHADDSDIFPCDICSDAFDTKNELSKHRSAKHRTSFYCDICSKHFINSRTLSRHIRSHMPEKPHQCDTCDLAFDDEIQLLDHTCLEMDESEVPKSGLKQPLYCVVCNKSLQGAYKLLRHYRSHTGEKQFHCNKCPQVFSNQNDFRQHKNKHRSEDASSSASPKTNKHRSEDAYSSASPKTNKHRSEDTSSSASPKTPGEHKEVCEMCGKVLRCRAHLIRHKLTHTGERPFPCDQCDRRFTELSGLKVRFITFLN